MNKSVLKDEWIKGSGTWYVAVFLLCILGVLVAITGNVFGDPAEETTDDFGDAAWVYIQYIDTHFPGRQAGNANSIACGDWIISQMESWGYTTEIHEFESIEPKNRCRNLVYVKQGASDVEIVFGAHYDSDPNTNGTDDNASGVAVVLEVARRIASEELPCTVRIIFWDDEEEGMIGSSSYLQQYGPGNAMCIINVDCVAAGDNRYAHSGGGEGGAAEVWLQEYAYDISAAYGLGFFSHPAVTDIPEGTRIYGSDQLHWATTFQIPYLYCEAGYYSDVRNPEKPNRAQTEDERVALGQIMHTPYDVLEEITGLFGEERVQEHLRAYSLLCYELVTRIQPGKTLSESKLNFPVLPEETSGEASEESTSPSIESSSAEETVTHSEQRETESDSEATSHNTDAEAADTETEADDALDRQGFSGKDIFVWLGGAFFGVVAASIVWWIWCVRRQKNR